MLAPSGSGGAFFTELLDDNWSEDYTRLVDNYRNPKLNEYAGSPNAVRLEFIDLDYEFNENSILLGKNDSPVEFFNLNSKHPCFSRPGDKIQFVEISKSQYKSSINRLDTPKLIEL